MSMVSLHNGGGVGIGKAINGGFGLVLDGSNHVDIIIRRAIQAALKHAVEVPLRVAYETLELMTLAEIVLKKGNPNAVTDGLVAVMMARTAILGALCNVKINLKSITDISYVSKLSAQVREMETMALKKEKDLLALGNL
jgi:formiminotetrahydrofolate cyclodeaminase